MDRRLLQEERQIPYCRLCSHHGCLAWGPYELDSAGMSLVSLDSSVLCLLVSGWLISLSRLVRTTISLFLASLSIPPSLDPMKTSTSTPDSSPRMLSCWSMLLGTELMLTRKNGADAVFAPERTIMYPEQPPYLSYVTIEGIDQISEGASRPGFYKYVVDCMISWAQGCGYCCDQVVQHRSAHQRLFRSEGWSPDHCHPTGTWMIIFHSLLLVC